jgi:general nucleoside transport system permease protein
VTDAPTPPAPPDEQQSFAERLALQHRLGGIAPPVITAVLAFLAGGIVVAATGHNPFLAYRDIFTGAGLNWFAHPWQTNIAQNAPYAMIQTLLGTTTLIFTGLAVAFAFRCGMFNIGGQGQYLMGLIVANWVGISIPGTPGPVHILLCVLAAVVAGAVWAGIAGFLKATVGAHEVISTIMLNWIAIYFGQYLFGDGGPLQDPTQRPNPISADVASSAKLPVFWGNPELQGLHIGLFVAIGMLVVFWLVLNRTTLGFEVRAVGFNPDAAAYGGISVRRNYVAAMAISGAFAGLGGVMDELGYLYHFGALDVSASSVGFLGIAVALLGRNTGIGVGLGAFLFGALLNGTSTRGLQSNVIPPELASNLTLMIQGLVVLFIGADVLILYVWNLRRRRPRLPRPEAKGT